MFGNGAAAAWQWRLGFFAVFSNDSMVPDKKALEQGSALVPWSAMDANKNFRNDAMGVGMQFSNVPWMLTQRSGNGGTLSVAKFNKGGKMLTQGLAFVPWLRGSAQRHTARLCSLVRAHSVWLHAWFDAGECSV